MKAGEAQESVSTRQRIRDAAVQLFGDRGFAATSMRDLAGATGLQAASLYAHFNSKEDLLVDVLDELADAFIGGAEQILASKTMSAEQRLKALFVFHFKVVNDNFSAATVHFHEYRHLSPDRKPLIYEKRDRYAHLVTSIIEKGIDEGAFRKVDLSLTAIQILSVLNYTYHWFSPRGRKSAKEMAELFADTFLRSLRADGPNAPESPAKPKSKPRKGAKK